MEGIQKKVALKTENELFHWKQIMEKVLDKDHLS